MLELMTNRELTTQKFIYVAHWADVLVCNTVGEGKSVLRLGNRIMQQLRYPSA